MFVDFYVFQTDIAASIIRKIEAKGYNVYVSKESGEKWARDHFTNENRYHLFYVEDFVDTYLQPGTPALCISVQEDYHHWEKVKTWVYNLWKDEDGTQLDFDKPEIKKRVYNPPGEEVLIDNIKSHVLTIKPDDIDLKEGYNYQAEYDEVNDIKYYEITAPSSPIPFTVVVSNFSKKDDRYLFTDIFASSAWAANRMECRYDFHFLTVLWKHLGLPGEFTSEILKQRVDSCYPDRVKDINELSAEPSVYRRGIKDVMKMKRKRLEETSFIPN